jgi:uncharacterized metal-binding protein YceD (DUF177 family)
MTDLKSEFSRPVDIERMGDRDHVMTVEASADECLALSNRLGIEKIHDLRARVAIRRMPGGRIHRVSGTLNADIIQACSVTLDAVESHINETFEEAFVKTKVARGDEPVELELDPEGDAPEPIENGVIDVGEVLAQILSLAIDPYVRSSAAAETGEAGDLEGNATSHPFAGLAELRDRMDGTG